MKYRIQVDLSFNTKEDADAFSIYVDKLKDKLYIPTEKEVTDREDLWVANRMRMIKDYDDEGYNKCGETQWSKQLIVPTKVIK